MISSVIFILLSIVMLVTAVISLYFRDLLASVVSYSVMSLVLTVMFFAEAGIGAALTVCIFVIAIKLTRRREE